jgi:hypothetical protein
MEAGTDAATLELRRVTVDDRTRLIAEGRYSEEFLPALAAWMIAHRDVRTETVTWFSPRASGPTMRQWDEPETDDSPGSERPDRSSA